MSMKSTQNTSKHSQGFTLIELIIIIVILGIFGTMGADFISRAFKGFQAANSRIEIFEEGKAAMTRMEREINNAIPNAVTTVSGGQELRIGEINDSIMVSDNVTGHYIESPPTNKITDETGGLEIGAIVSINNTEWDTFANPVPLDRRLYKVITKTGKEMTLDRTIPSASRSPNKRFYAVDKAIRYYYDSGSAQLRRSEITINATNTALDDTAFTSVSGYPLAANVSNLTFHYTPGTPSRNSVVTVSFKITKNNESILFNKDIHVRNTP
ncbi:hypothetical protein MNBD_DELTA03-1471 [hydrothermal vent metagenome]|uniref:MSHA biogenesis protein MshO n=1 Tax=hydrothermal vent metagenome TaxID=652676 RepID=A0A3B0VR11_9ZZZZ